MRLAADIRRWNTPAALLIVAVASCGGASSKQGETTPAAQAKDAVSVQMSATPPPALGLCERIWLMRRICPREVPFTNGRPQPRTAGPYGAGAFAGCSSAGRTPIEEPLGSKRCAEALWDYQILPTHLPLPAWTHGKTILSPSDVLPPPWYVHVLLYAAVGGSPFQYPLQPGGPRRLTESLISSFHSRAISLGRIRWAGISGMLELGPSYPAGGEAGGHLIFSFSVHGVYYGITLHAWPLIYRFTAGNRAGSVDLHSTAGQVLATLKAVVASTLG